MIHSCTIKTALVFGNGPNPRGILTDLIITAFPIGHGPRVAFVEPVSFSEKLKRHVRKVIVPLVDSVVRAMGFRIRRFEISAATVGGASMMGLPMVISGFSADLPLFIGMLGANCRVSMPVDAVMTGHIGSVDGRVRTVGFIEEKLTAVLREESIRRFFHASKDQSLSALSSFRRIEIQQSLREAAQIIDVHSIADVGELVLELLAEEDIVLESLKGGFFGRWPRRSKLAAANVIANHFLQGSRKRFNDLLAKSWMSGDRNLTTQLLERFVIHHLRKGTYPKGFGFELECVVRSIPQPARRLSVEFPIISEEMVARAKELAGDANGEDCQLLIPLLLGDAEIYARDNGLSPEGSVAVDFVIGELSGSNLEQQIDRPIEEARATYTYESVTVVSEEEFSDVLTSFCMHVLRRLDRLDSSMSEVQLGGWSLRLLNEAFGQMGGHEHAFYCARTGVKGGLRFVLDRLCDQLRIQQREAYSKSVIRRAIDSRSWQERRQFVAVLSEKYRHLLPSEHRTMSSGQLAHEYENLALCSSESMTEIQRLFRTK